MKRVYSHALQKYRYTSIISAVLLLVFAVISMLLHQLILAAAEAAVGLIVFVIALRLKRSRKKEIAKHLKKIKVEDDGISENMLTSVPMPMVICSIDGTISWYNDQFKEIYKEKKLAEQMLDDCIPEIKWSDVLKSTHGKDIETTHDGSTYSVCWYILKNKQSDIKAKESYSVFFYLKDVTMEKEILNNYQNERIDVAFINIDNYDEFTQKTDDDIVEKTSSKLRSEIVNWARISDAVLKKLDYDRYFAIFEHQHLKTYSARKFDIIKRVDDVAALVKFPLAISMGIGTGGSLSENEESARHALDLALGRGGGQVCIKDQDRFKFYGGKSGDYERSTRVKARAVCAALSDYIKSSDNVIFMGHKNADFDCFGAAIGLQRAVRRLGKSPYIVRERISPAIENMYNALKNVEEYNGMFVDESEVIEEITPNTLLVVLDTHRPSMLPCSKLLEKINKIVLIDHHRRSTEFISPCSLVYHEPYASSTCEMVTEILEYMNIDEFITKTEAQCLYTGILMDTKNFMLKTGVRTFEAASYLRKLGLDTMAVRRMFSTSKDLFALKAEIISTAEPAAEGIAIAKTNKSNKNMREIASQAADEMLNIDNNAASIVVYPADGGVGFSARSIGSVNVQLIMEKLGGGGHMTVSGAYMKGIGIDEGIRYAKSAVKSYLEETKK